MSKVVIICGNKRSGKTTLSLILHNKYNFNYYNFDMILDSIESSFPQLDDKNDKKYIKLLESMVERSLDDAKNYNVSSVYDYIFSPEDLSDFKYKNAVDIYFLANLDATKQNIKDDLVKYSQDYDWPKKCTEEDLNRNIKFILDFNKKLNEQCHKYSFKLINTSREDKRNIILSDLASIISKE